MKMRVLNPKRGFRILPELVLALDTGEGFQSRSPEKSRGIENVFSLRTVGATTNRRLNGSQRLDAERKTWTKPTFGLRTKAFIEGQAKRRPGKPRHQQHNRLARFSLFSRKP
jgi:hypothetical protein